VELMDQFRWGLREGVSSLIFAILGSNPEGVDHRN
jgi:hypothetical protein